MQEVAVIEEKNFFRRLWVKTSVNPIKALFAMEYVLQGAANPFFGITYLPILFHFIDHYGLSDAKTQSLFSYIYLAWGFKPIIGFIFDAIAKIKLSIVSLMVFCSVFWFIVPLLDINYLVFYATLFIGAIFFASSDVVVDRATVVVGHEEAKVKKLSRASTVSLNQAICWAAIYGTGIATMVISGWAADNLLPKYVFYIAGAFPILVLSIAVRLPKDTVQSISIIESMSNFVKALKPDLLWASLFFFLFHFQPALGVIWTNFLRDDLGFSKTLIGWLNGISYFGLFIGVLAYRKYGIKLQEKFGLRYMFKIYMVLNAVLTLMLYLVRDQFSGGAIYFISGVVSAVIRMATFALVGAVVPPVAAGSLFAGFMSISNIGSWASYRSGAYLRELGLSVYQLIAVQAAFCFLAWIVVNKLPKVLKPEEES